MGYSKRQIQAFIDPESLQIVEVSGDTPRFGERFRLKMTDKVFDTERQLLRCTFDVVEDNQQEDGPATEQSGDRSKGEGLPAATPLLSITSTES